MKSVKFIFCFIFVQICLALTPTGNRSLDLTVLTPTLSEKQLLENKTINRFISFGNNPNSPWKLLQDKAQLNLEKEEERMKEYTRMENEEKATFKAESTDMVFTKELISPNQKYVAKMDEDGIRLFDHGIPFRCYGPKSDIQRLLPIENPEIKNEAYESGKKHLQSQLGLDGNLSVSENGKILWETNTRNKGVPPYRLYMNNSRDLEIIDSSGKVIWSSETKTTYTEFEVQNSISSFNNISDISVAAPISLFSLNGKFRLYLDEDGILSLFKGHEKVWQANQIKTSESSIVINNKGRLYVEGKDTKGLRIETFSVGDKKDNEKEIINKSAKISNLKHSNESDSNEEKNDKTTYTLFLTDSGNLEIYNDLTQKLHWSLFKNKNK